MILRQIKHINFLHQIKHSSFLKFGVSTYLPEFYIKLEDVDQNYEIYEKLFNKFNFKNKMTKKQFYGVINKAPNKGPNDKYNYKDWNNLEKKEFENIIKRIFPHYDNIKTNI